MKNSTNVASILDGQPLDPSMHHPTLDHLLDELSTEYYTVAEYLRAEGLELPHGETAAFGRAATKSCRAFRVAYRSVPDPRFGLVHTYPLDILQAVKANLHPLQTRFS